MVALLFVGWAYVHFSVGRRPALPAGNASIPQERQLTWSSDSIYSQAVLRFWSEQPIGEWQTRGKGDEPRALLARLHSRHLLPETNAYLMSLQPWGKSGSSWPVHRQGDYDFTLTVLTSILWLYGEDETRLKPETREHLLHVLLTEDGHAFRETVPRTLGLVRETENHLLMTEGSRYLKNRWLEEQGDRSPRFDNSTNGMEEKLLELLAELRTAGLYEFNSQPYIGYTLAALLNLEAFGSAVVRDSARELLDQLNWFYALGSYRLRHYPPFRRRYEYASALSLNLGYQTAYMHMWLSFSDVGVAAPKVRKRDATHALMASCLPYRPPDEVVRLIFSKERGYFARLGHGPGGSPEIYSAGKGFLLSAGGVNRGSRSQIVARPITLLLDDGRTDLSEVFHLAGPGADFQSWNNTGVYGHFACAAGPVHVPAHVETVESKGAWSLYAPSPGVWVVVHSTDELGLLLPLAEPPAEGFLSEIIRENSDPTQLLNTFRFPGGSRLIYDLRSPKDQWVMMEADGVPLDRGFDAWPIVDVQPSEE